MPQYTPHRHTPRRSIHDRNHGRTEHWTEKAAKLAWQNRAHIASSAGWAYEKGRLLWPESGKKKHSIAKLEGPEGASMHSGLNVRKWTLVSSDAKCKSARGATTILLDTRSVLQQGQAGQQYSQTINLTGTASQWATSTPNTSLLPIFASEIGYFSMNANQKQTGGAVIQTVGIPNVVPQMDRFCFKAEETLLDMTNFSSASAQVKLYAFRCIKYTNKDPNSLWSDALAYADAGYSTAATFPAVGTQFPAVPGYLTSVFAGLNPKHKLIADNWKLLGQIDCQLQGGATERIRLRIKHNWIGKSELIGENGTTFVPGTVAIIAVVLGSPVMDTTVTDVPTYSSTKIGYIINSRKFFKPVFMNAGRVVAELGFSTVPANTIAGNQKEISAVDSDIPVAFAV